MSLWKNSFLFFFLEKTGVDPTDERACQQIWNICLFCKEQCITNFWVQKQVVCFERIRKSLCGKGFSRSHTISIWKIVNILQSEIVYSLNPLGWSNIDGNWNLKAITTNISALKLEDTMSALSVLLSCDRRTKGINVSLGLKY